MRRSRGATQKALEPSVLFRIIRKRTILEIELVEQSRKPLSLLSLFNKCPTCVIELRGHSAHPLKFGDELLIEADGHLTLRGHTAILQQYDRAGQAVSVMGRSTQDMRPRSLRPTSSMGCCSPAWTSLAKLGRPASSSPTHSSANVPSWISRRILRISSRTESLITRGPRVTSPYSAVSETE